MNNNPNRVARLTSSKISVLTVNGKGLYGFRAGAITYIKQCAMELDFGRSISLPINKWEMSWGKAFEVFVHWQLGNEYELIVDKSTVHPKYPFYSGSEDFRVHINGGCIAELKCYQMENFYKYSKCLEKQDIKLFKSEFKSEYWQIVSNSIIQNVQYGEAIAYMPTQADLLEMRRLIEDTDYIETNLKDDPFKYKFIVDRDLYDLPFIPEHSELKSMVKFRFEVPTEDKIFLLSRILDAKKVLDSL